MSLTLVICVAVVLLGLAMLLVVSMCMVASRADRFAEQQRRRARLRK